MKNKDICTKIDIIYDIPTDYVVFSVDENKCYYGKNRSGEIVFMIPSKSAKSNSFCQETKALLFYNNKKCTFTLDGIPVTKTMHIFVCKERAKDKIDAFVRLTHAFSVSESENDTYYVAKLFSAISMLFDRQRQISEIEIQGLFAELFVILHFYKRGCRIDKHWQSRSRMTFDFSIDEKCRLEIKSTLKNSRIHHFRHDQLLSELYDIKIVSLMLQKNDRGISLGELIASVRETFSDNFALLLRIEQIACQIDEEQLFFYRYDKTYAEQNMRFFDAEKIPHFREKTPEGVFNAEYDCCLDNVGAISEKTMIEWLTRCG